MPSLSSSARYNVSWKALDTSQYSGLPHHRVRVFIAGVLAKSQKSDMKWPDPIPMRPLNDFLEKKQPEVALNSLAPGYYNHVKTALTRIINQGDDPFKNQYVVDISCSQKRQAHFMKGVSPCLTKNRAASKGHWLTKESRWMTRNEVLALMGVSQSDFPHGVVSAAALGGIAGNAVPIPLVQRVIDSLLKSAGLM